MRGFDVALEGVGFAEETDGGGEGKAHDVEEVAFDAGDPAGGVALDAVGSGFVEAVAGGEVVGEVGGGDGGEEDGGGFDVRALGGGCDDGDAGMDLVRAVGELAKHALGVGEVCGLVEDLCVVEDYGGVCAEDGGVGVAGLVDVGGEDVEAEGGLGEEVAAAG